MALEPETWLRSNHSSVNTCCVTSHKLLTSLSTSRHMRTQHLNPRVVLWLFRAIWVLLTAPGGNHTHLTAAN